MRSRSRLHAALLVAAICGAAPAAVATTIDVLTWIPGSTVKVEQLIGDHDWVDTTRTVRSRTVTEADVLGNGLGYSFESGDSLIMLFGDTIGASSQYVPRWADSLNDFRWAAREPLASSRTSDRDSLLLLSFYRDPVADTTITLAPVYPDGTPVPMGADDIPNSGIDLGNQIDLVCSIGTTIVNGVADHSQDSSIVVRFDPTQRTFTAGRTISRAGQNGHFVFTAPVELPMQFASSSTDSEVVIFGLGEYRQSDVYLSMIRKHRFESGVKADSTPATRYFTGLVNGQPAWGDTESLAVPIVFDNPLQSIGVGVQQNPWPNDSPTSGNLSAVWSPALNLWLMMFDGGRQPGSTRKQTEGFYFTYASAPWGPWMPPQLVLNSTRDSLEGVIIHHYDHNTGVESGPAGPTIGSQTINDPDTTSGGTFAPEMIGRLARIAGDTLTIDYTVSTWNPYTVVRMRSAFLIHWNATLGADAPRPVATLRLDAGPNPFRAGATVAFTLPAAGAVDLDVLDVAGRRVRRLAHGPFAAGRHEARWDAGSDAGGLAPAGLYFLRLRAPGGAVTRRIARVE